MATILVVDDLATNRDLLVTILKYHGHHLIEAADGVEALAYLHGEGPYKGKGKPDVILLDLNMPRMSGHEVLTRIKGDEELRSIPVVVLTTTQFPEDIDRCYEMGASAYLVKPMELEQFLSLVKITVAFWSACKFRKLAEIEHGT